MAHRNQGGGNFIEHARDSVENEINQGHAVFKIRANTNIMVEEISGEGQGVIWDWETLYVSRPASVQNMSQHEAMQEVGFYYDGQEENGVLLYDPNSIHIQSVQRYDFNNIANLPLQGETYKTRAVKGLRDIQLLLEKKQCLFDYLCYKIVGKIGFESYTRQQLLNELGGNTTLCIQNIIDWIKKGTKKGNYDKNVNIFAWWENRRLCHKFISNNKNKNTIALNFIISDQHVEPIENDKLFSPNQLKDLQTLTKNAQKVEAETNWILDYHFNNFFYVDHSTLFENWQSIMRGTFKPEYEALVFETDHMNDVDIISIGNQVMLQTKHKLSFIDLKRQIFKHPTSPNHQNYVFCTDFKKRKEACDTLFDKTKIINLNFTNQSWGEISMVLIDRFLDNSKQWSSTFTPRVQQIVDDLCCKPLVQGLCDFEPLDKTHKLVVWDINKCYTMAIYDLLINHYIPIYNLGDDIEQYDETKHRYKLSKKNFYHKKLKPALFYLPSTVLQPYGLILKEGMYPHILIQYLIDNNHITYNDLTYVLPSRRYAPGKDLANFVKTVWDLLKGTPYGKMIINVAVGLFNTKYEGKRDEVMLSHSAPFTIAYKDWIEQQNDPDVEVKITGCDNLDMDWIRTISKKRKMQDTGVINQYVVASGLVRTLQMLKTKWNDGYTLVGIKTDAIYLAIPKNKMSIACKNDPILAYMNYSDVWNLHPMYYNDTIDHLKEYHCCDEYETPVDTLELIQQYPYKLEFGKKPPKYDPDRINQLKSTVGVKRDLICKPILDRDEKYLLKKIDILTNIVDSDNLTQKQIDYLVKSAKEWFSILIYGTAGSGKTTLGIKIQILLVKIAKLVNKHVVVTTFQRTTANAWIGRLVKNKIDIDDNCKIVNWDQYWGNVYEGGVMKKVKFPSIDPKDVFAVLIDEFFQLPRRCLLDLCQMQKENCDIIFVPIGDYNQIPAIESPNYNWIERDLLATFVSHKLKKNYIHDCGRFSKTVLKLLKYLECRDFDSFRNWVKKNKRRLSCDDLTATKYHICKARKKKYNNSVEKINEILCPEIKSGCEVICDNVFRVDRVDENNEKVVRSTNKKGKKSYEKTEILVGEKYPVVQCNDNKCLLKVNDCGVVKFGWFPIKYTKKNGTVQQILSPAYASTAFREQGREICEPYTIHGAHNMTLQELIVAISRGKSKTGILFKFSCIDELLKQKYWKDAYDDISIKYPLPIHGRIDLFTKATVVEPEKCDFEKYLLYIIEDDNNDKYVGITEWDEYQTLEDNLNTRMEGHLKTNVPKNKLSPVLGMINPKIRPFYNNVDDDFDDICYLYGTLKQIMKVEERHIQKIMIECKNDNVKYFNRDRTKTQPTLDEEKLKEHNVLNKHIENCINEFAIVPKNGKFVMYGKNIAQTLGNKTDKVRKSKIDKMLNAKIEGIASLCVTTKQRVQKVYDVMLKNTKKDFI